MIETNDTAPLFTATRGTSDHETFELEDHIGDGPIVLAFFPGCVHAAMYERDDRASRQD